MISESLKDLEVDIDSLLLDPENERKHPDRNLDALERSLGRFGQQKPIVLDQDGKTVIAGNGMLQAARRLGWTKIAAVKSNLEGDDVTGYRIADNRTAELAEWDPEAIRKSVGEIDIQVEDLGFTEGEFGDLVADLELAEYVEEKGNGSQSIGGLENAVQLMPDREYVVIVCDPGDEEQWEELKKRLQVKPCRRGGYKRGSEFDPTGANRVIRAKKFLEMMGSDADSDSKQGTSG